MVQHQCPSIDNDIKTLPSIQGTPLKILPKLLQACVENCVVDNNLNVYAVHKQILEGTDEYVSSLVYLDSVSVPNKEEIEGVSDCTSYCIHEQIWVDHQPTAGVYVDVTNKDSPQVDQQIKRVADPDGTIDDTFMVLTVGSTKGPKTPLVSSKAVVGIVAGGISFVVLSLLASLFVVFKLSRSNPQIPVEAKEDAGLNYLTFEER